VLLDVAVKQGQAGLIGGKIDDRATVVRNYNRILNNTGSLFAIDLGEFETVSMKMHGMSVIGTVAHDQPVTHSWLQHELPFVGIRFAVDKP